MAKSEETAAAEKPKSKKLLIIIIGVLLVLLLGGGAAAFLLMSKSADEEEEGADAPKAKAEAKAKPKKPAGPPTFMPLDAVVVNLADAGSTRYAQVGITLQVEDAPTADLVKQYMPAIRNGILMAISRRTADQLLSAEGKEELANEILTLIRKTTDTEEHRGYSPVEAVLFSSIIVQ
ncbi:flagellar basal body-associated FliL family protein [Tepidimonas sp.]|uniref:flagellar basal body-associated FliL family protein n=1 Tax=Tepidimonas sp. TaxID=2002775 RepID=UPI002FE40B94